VSKPIPGDASEAEVRRLVRATEEAAAAVVRAIQEAGSALEAPRTIGSVTFERVPPGEGKIYREDGEVRVRVLPIRPPAGEEERVELQISWQEAGDEGWRSFHRRLLWTAKVPADHGQVYPRAFPRDRPEERTSPLAVRVQRAHAGEAFLLEELGFEVPDGRRVTEWNRPP
jgi:hypothetical protein